MTEVGTPSADQKQPVGAVLGRVLYHALLGHCFSLSLPDESFFLDYIIDRLGSENFTVEGKDSNTCITADIFTTHKYIPGFYCVLGQIATKSINLGIIEYFL